MAENLLHVRGHYSEKEINDKLEWSIRLLHELVVSIDDIGLVGHTLSKAERLDKALASARHALGLPVPRGNCGLCKGAGVADLPDPWGGVRGTCPDCHGSGNSASPSPSVSDGGEKGEEGVTACENCRIEAEFWNDPGRKCVACIAGVPGTPAHSKSEYKRREALGDPNVAPPAGVGGNDVR